MRQDSSVNPAKTHWRQLKYYLNVIPAKAGIQGEGKSGFLSRFAALTFGPLKTMRE
jgi:hypothetical protein